MTPSIECRVFGYLQGSGPGKQVDAWTLSGAGGLHMEAITYGGIVTRLLVPDRNGEMADVVLGYNDLDSYVADRWYLGAIVGRVASRVAEGRLILDGNDYQLPRNESQNHLHGGHVGFNKRLWSATPLEMQYGEASLRLTYHSPDQEEGYPASVDVSVTYTVRSDNTFFIETEATSDGATPVRLTHHSYFNLAGEASGNITDHRLQVHADRFVPLNEDATASGRVESVKAGANDLRAARQLDEVIPKVFGEHGDLYILNREAQEHGQSPLLRVAALEHDQSGRKMEVWTTESHMQLYTGVGLDGSCFGKSQVPYKRFAGLCLECQGPPIVNGEACPEELIVRPGKPQRQITAYAFSTSE